MQENGKEYKTVKEIAMFSAWNLDFSDGKMIHYVLGISISQNVCFVFVWNWLSFQSVLMPSTQIVKEAQRKV